MPARQPTTAVVNWRQRGRDDAPVAQRAIIRSLFDDAAVPGHACAYAIIDAYGSDLKLVAPGVMGVNASKNRHELLLQLIEDANHDEWMQVFLGGPENFMAEYWAGFLKELDSQMANWAPKPWKPGTNADWVAEEGKWRLALAMGDLTLSEPNVPAEPGPSAAKARANKDPLATASSKPAVPKAHRSGPKRKSGLHRLQAVPPVADDALVSVWEARGRADGPIAFRTIVRAVKDGAEGSGDAPDQKAAANLWAWTVAGNSDALGEALGYLAETVNRDRVASALATNPSGTFVSDYIAAFVGAYDAATVDFRAAATVGDYLGVAAPEEDCWRAALRALWVTMSPSDTIRGSARQGPGAPRLVVFHYCVSLGIVSFKRSSGVKVILPGGSRFLAGLPYTLISICAGWWGIPWGPIWTLQAIGRNLGGGTDVTALVRSEGI